MARKPTTGVMKPREGDAEKRLFDAIRKGGVKLALATVSGWMLSDLSM